MTMSPTIVPSAPDVGLGKSAATTSPLTSPESKLKKKKGELRRPVLSPTRAISPIASHSPHPLSQPPITATASATGTLSKSPAATAQNLEASPTQQSPSPVIPPQVRQSFRRRRSSFPPAAGSAAAAHSWMQGASGTLASGHEPFSSNAGWPSANGLTPLTGNWESLLNFESDYGKSPSSGVGMERSPSQNAKVETEAKAPAAPSPRYNTPLKTSNASQQHTMERTASGNDQTWRTILNQTLDVEGVGNVAVARILTEVWKRGGPAAVTAYSLWSSILVSLSLSPDHGTSARTAPPSAQSALSLQALYNVAIRPHEATIFAGFLSSYHASTAPAAVNAFSDTQVYGSWTPTKGMVDQDLAQWTTFTPGAEWPSLSTTLPSGSGLTPRREFTPALGLPPIEVSVANEEDHRPESRGAAEGINGINEILAEMEDTTNLQESEEPAGSADQLNWAMANAPNSVTEGSEGDVFQSTSGERRQSSSHAESPVETMVPLASSPFVSGGSSLSATSASTNIPSLGQQPMHGEEKLMRAAATPCAARVRPPPPLQLALPEAPFIPPPPMCMFFSPTFRDLQKGKVAVWKGDLVIRGRGGGTFNVLIVGEQGSDHLWQSHTWHDKLTYPPSPVVTETYTATMIPVSTLAREGLLPVTMGMVLCNDDRMEAFVQMVQGLHAEGVAFHLPMPGSGLPIVFLPAKFDSADPLQRLGIAFMTKGGAAPDFSAPTTRRSSEDSIPADHKRRRKDSTSKEKDLVSRPSTRRKKAPVRPKTS